MVKRAHWVVLAPTVALGALCEPALAQDVKPDDAVRRQAEELAEEASKKFGEVLKQRTPEAKAKPPSSPLKAADRERTVPLLLYWLDYSEHEYKGILRRLALEGAEKGWDPATIGWLKRSSQEFQAIMQRLARAGAPASKWDPVAEAHQRAGRDKGRAEEGGARPSAAVEPGAAVAGIGPRTGAEDLAGGPRTGEAEATRLPAGDGRAAVEAPPTSDPGPGAIAAADPMKPHPGPPPGPAAEPAPAAADPAVATKKGEERLGREAGERPAGLAGTEAARPHEEEEDTSTPGAVTAAAKPARDSPTQDKPGPAASAVPPAGPAESNNAPAQAAKKFAEDKPAQDRPAMAPVTRPDTAAPDQPAAFTAPSPALAQRHASKIATPAEPKSRPSRPAKATGGERCPAAGIKVSLPGWYVVKTGDTLWAIAERHYGAGARYRTIFLANRERLKRGPDVIMPCQQLYLPRQRRRGA
ncbi:MAG TPA: LysM peptidoglycan-binding domain-containing protein [Hyphomicrobiaceae bacterium]|nr:LysM peptidoglycan-binding domain-containing protein [Hyphomicrobiaceae bacterium]